MNDCCNRPGQEGFDVAVIGAGSAGFSAAIAAADLGAKVALVGHGTNGGTCVNVGCVPSKTLLRAAEAVHGGLAAARFPGLGGAVQMDDWSVLAASKDDLVTTLRQKKYVDLLPAYDGVSYIEGKARFADGALSVGDAPMKVGKVILAMGAHAAVPPIPGMGSVPYLPSASALALGADLAYMGTRFVATAEANAEQAYKQHLIEYAADDIVYTNLFTGVHGNYLAPSVAAAGLDPRNLPEADKSKMNFGSGGNMKQKAWKDIWGSGQGIGQIKDAPHVAELVDRLKAEYAEACKSFAAKMPA